MHTTIIDLCRLWLLQHSIGNVAFQIRICYVRCVHALSYVACQYQSLLTLRA